MRQGKLKLKSSTVNETEVKSIQEEMCVGLKDGVAACEKSQTARRLTRKNGQITQTLPKPKNGRSQDISSSNEDSDLDDSSSDTQSLQDKTRYKCQVCGAAFQRPWRLAAHRRIHTNEKPFKCDSAGCLKSYAYSHHLDRHKSRSHSDLVVVEKIPCSAPGCHMLFSSALNVLKHYKRFHDAAAFGFACPECDSKFRKHRQLRLHMIQHTGEAPFKCKECDRGFTALHLLNRHLRGHREYKCDIPGCDRKLPNQSAFRKHKAEHNACFTTMDCAHCSKEFKSKATLRAHVKMHIGEASVFKCTYGNCERVYYQKRNLSQHVRLRHEKISNFKCSQEGCERIFATQKKLDIHTKWHINGPTPPKPRTEPRKRRKDAGITKRSFAAKLAGVVVPYSVEKQLLKNQSTSDFVHSDEDNPESDIESQLQQPDGIQESQGNQCASCPDISVQPDLDEGLERSEGIVILECVAEESQQTLKLSSSNVSEVCASSKDTILVPQQDGVCTSETLGIRASENENRPFDESQNQSCSESAESTVPVTPCLEKLEHSDLIMHITSPQEAVLALQAEKDNCTTLCNGTNVAPGESGSTALDKGEETPTTPENLAQVLLVIFENPGGEGIDSNSIYINPDTIVEFADDPLSPSPPPSNAAGDLSVGKAEGLSVAGVPNNNFDSVPDESPCCQTKDDFSINKLNITVSNTSHVSEMKSNCEELLDSSKFDSHYPYLDKMKKISAEPTIEDVAVHQLTKLLHSISSNVAPRQSPRKVKIASSKITENFSSDCVMDLPGPVRGHADDQEDSDSAEEDHDEAHDENSDSDRDDDFLHQDDSAEEEHAGGEGNGEDGDDDDDDDDDDENDNENHDDDEVEGDGDEDDDENDSDDNHGAQEPNDDNNNSNDSNCDSSSDGNRTIGGQTDSESSNDSHNFGNGSDMGVDRSLPPVTNQNVRVAEVPEKLSSEDEEVDVEDCKSPVERSARDSSEEEKQSVKFTADPSPRMKSARVQVFEPRKRIAIITEVSQDEEEMVEASEQADNPVIEASTNGKKSKPVTQSSKKPKNERKKQEEKSLVVNIHFRDSAMKEDSTQLDISVRTERKRSCSDGLPPAKKFVKITESVRVCSSRSQAKDSEMGVRAPSRRPQAQDLLKDRRICGLSPLTENLKKALKTCSESPLVKDTGKGEKNEQSQRKACSELTEELWLNVLRQTKDLWKLNEPLLSENKIK